MARTVVPVTTVTPPKASLTTALTGTHNDLVFTAKVAGPGGNQIRVQYVVSGTNTALSVEMRGYDIIVNVATDGGGAAISTASQVMTAVLAAAYNLVDVALAAANDGSGVVTSLSITNLAGGSLQTSQPSQTNSDTTNKHYFTGNDGYTVIEVFNNNAAPQTVTVLYSPFYAPIATVAGQVETIPNAGTRILGPFSPAAFEQNASHDIYFDPSVATDLKFRVYKISKPA